MKRWSCSAHDIKRCEKSATKIVFTTKETWFEISTVSHANMHGAFDLVHAVPYRDNPESRQTYDSPGAYGALSRLGTWLHNIDILE